MNDLERIELDAAADFWAAAPASVRHELETDVADLGGARCLRCRDLQPTLMFRRALVLGPPAALDLDAIGGHMGASGQAWALGCAPAEGRDRLATALAARGFTAARAWMKFRRDCRPVAGADTGLDVRRLEAADGAAFASVVARTYGLGGMAPAWLAPLTGRPRWICFAAFDGGRPVAAAAAYVDGDHAWLGFAATLPEARRRGAQSALLARRIEAAAAGGARVVVTETGERVGDQPNPSYHNIRRAGFDEVGLRAHWLAPG